MNKTLRNALIAAGTVVALVLALPYLVPLDAYKGRIEATAANATGRATRIEGPRWPDVDVLRIASFSGTKDAGISPPRTVSVLLIARSSRAMLAKS